MWGFLAPGWSLCQVAGWLWEPFFVCPALVAIGDAEAIDMGGHRRTRSPLGSAGYRAAVGARYCTGWWAFWAGTVGSDRPGYRTVCSVRRGVIDLQTGSRWSFSDAQAVGWASARGDDTIKGRLVEAMQ